MRFSLLNLSRSSLLAGGLLALSCLAQITTAAVKVEGAWTRATVAGQQGSGAFMNLTASSALKLVGVSSPVAGVTELHEMKMEGDIMRMRPVPAIDLPAGTRVQLKPGGFHVMLMDLKTPLRKDTQIPLTLVLQNAQGQTSQVQVSVPVMLSAPSGATAGHGGHGAGHKH
jgi:copper(I)-binding protein